MRPHGLVRVHQHSPPVPRLLRQHWLYAAVLLLLWGCPPAADAAAPGSCVTVPDAVFHVTSDCFLSSGKYTFSSVTVANGVTLSVADAVELHVKTSITVSENATIDASATSLAGSDASMAASPGIGGCHAGCPSAPFCPSVAASTLPAYWRNVTFNAAIAAPETWSVPYGSWYAPRTRGSRGSNGTLASGATTAHFGAGGGALLLNSSSLVLGRGSRIRVDGGSPVATTAGAALAASSGGAGAGGSLYIIANLIELAAPSSGSSAALPLPLLTARGGIPVPNGPALSQSSTGGGGRIAVVCKSCLPSLESAPFNVSTAIPFVALSSAAVADAAPGTAFLTLGGAAFLIVEGTTSPCQPPVLAGLPPPQLSTASSTTGSGDAVFTFEEIVFATAAARLHLSARGGWYTAAGGWANAGSNVPATLSLTAKALRYRVQPSSSGAPGLVIEEGVTLTLNGGEQAELAFRLPLAAAAGSFPVTLPTLAASAPPCDTPLASAPLFLLPAALTILGKGRLAFPSPVSLAPAVAGAVLSLEAVPSTFNPFVNVPNLFLFGPNVILVAGPQLTLSCLRVRDGGRLRLTGTTASVSLTSAWWGPQGYFDSPSSMTSATVTVANDFRLGPGAVYTFAGLHTLSVTNGDVVVEAGAVMAGRVSGRTVMGAPPSLSSGMGGTHAGCGAVGGALSNDLCRNYTLAGAGAPRAYGRAASPLDLGASGVRPGMASTPVNGGAAITIYARTACVNGTITASAATGSAPTTGNLTLANTPTGGSGGSVWLYLGNLLYSNGTLSADGAAVALPGAGGVVTQPVGGGGGGRVTLTCASAHPYSSDDPEAWPLSLSAAGGASNDGTTAGGPGTVYVACFGGNGPPPALLVRQPPSVAVSPAGARIFASPSFVVDAPGVLATGGHLGRLVVTGGVSFMFAGTQSINETAGQTAIEPSADILKVDLASAVGFNYLVQSMTTGGFSNTVNSRILASTVRVMPPLAPLTLPNEWPPACPAGSTLDPSTDLVLEATCTLWGNYNVKSFTVAVGVTVRVAGAVTITASEKLTLFGGAKLDGTGGARGAPPWLASLPMLSTGRLGIGGCHATCGDTRATADVSALPNFDLTLSDNSCSPAIVFSQPYGDAFAPVECGNTGGAGRNASGAPLPHYGHGGGAVRIVTPLFMMADNSSIVMDGEPPSLKAPMNSTLAVGGGSGAGGSIWISVSIMAVPGSAVVPPLLAARGGPVLPATAGGQPLRYSPSAAGGGGRVLLDCTLCERWDADALDIRTLGPTVDYSIPTTGSTGLDQPTGGLGIVRLGSFTRVVVEERLRPKVGVPFFGLPGTRVFGWPTPLRIDELVGLGTQPALLISRRPGTFVPGPASNVTVQFGAIPIMFQGSFVQPVQLLVESGLRMVVVAPNQTELYAPGAVLTAAVSRYNGMDTSSCPTPLTSAPPYFFNGYLQLPAGAAFGFANPATLVLTANELTIGSRNALFNVSNLFLENGAKLTLKDGVFNVSCLRLGDLSTMALTSAMTGLPFSLVTEQFVSRASSLSLELASKVTLQASQRLAVLQSSATSFSSLMASRQLSIVSGGDLVLDSRVSITCGRAYDVTGTPVSPGSEGGAHAGCGGTSTGTGMALNGSCLANTAALRSAPRAHGSTVAPADAGGSGWSVSYNPVSDPYGGGAVLLSAGGTLTLNAQVMASASAFSSSGPGNITASNRVAGGSAGGSIYVVAKSLVSSTGKLAADGAAAPTPSGGYSVLAASGGGSGGRIAVAIESHGFGTGSPATWPLDMSAVGGLSNDGVSAGAAGTVYVAVGPLGAPNATYLLARQAPYMVGRSSQASFILEPFMNAPPGVGTVPKLEEVTLANGATITFLVNGTGTTTGTPSTKRLVTSGSFFDSYRVNMLPVTAGGGASSGSSPVTVDVNEFTYTGGGNPSNEPGLPQCPNEPGIENARVTLASPCSFLSGSYSFRSLTVATGVSVTFWGRVNITVTESFVLGDSAVLNGTGRAGPQNTPPSSLPPGVGGCHGGCSQVFGTGAGWPLSFTLSAGATPVVVYPYGSFWTPDTAGSRGTDAQCTSGGMLSTCPFYGGGGAALTIDATAPGAFVSLGSSSQIAVDGGAPVAQGTLPANVTYPGGSGAGGSIFIKTNRIQFTSYGAVVAGLTPSVRPRLSAAGGNYLGSLPLPSSYNGGGGGRIAVVCSNCTMAAFASTLVASTLPAFSLGPAASAAVGSGGTVFYNLSGLFYLYAENNAPNVVYPPLISGWWASSVELAAFGTRGSSPRVTFVGESWDGIALTPDGAVPSLPPPSLVSTTITIRRLEFSTLLTSITGGTLLRLAGEEQVQSTGVTVWNGVMATLGLPPCKPLEGTSLPVFVLGFPVRFIRGGRLGFLSPTRLLTSASTQTLNMVGGNAPGTSDTWPFLNVSAVVFSSTHGFVPALSTASAITAGGNCPVSCVWGRSGTLYVLPPQAPSILLPYLALTASSMAVRALDVNVEALHLDGGAVLTVTTVFTSFVSQNFTLAAGAIISAVAVADAIPGAAVTVADTAGGAHAGCGGILVTGSASNTSLACAAAYSFQPGSSTSALQRPHDSTKTPSASGAGRVAPGYGLGGGGTIAITATGYAVINGTIDVSAAPSSSSTVVVPTTAGVPGGGSGGSIFIQAQVLKHSTGLLKATGGAAATPSNDIAILNPSAGGSGGRIAVQCGRHEFAPPPPGSRPYASQLDWPLRAFAPGGLSSENSSLPRYSMGAAGTYYVDCSSPFTGAASGVAPYDDRPSLAVSALVPTVAGSYRKAVVSTSYVLDDFADLASYGTFGTLRVSGGASLAFLFNATARGGSMGPSAPSALRLETDGDSSIVLINVPSGSTPAAFTAIGSPELVTQPPLANDLLSGLPEWAAPSTVLPACPAPARLLDVLLTASCVFRNGSYAFKTLTVAPGVAVYIEDVVMLTALNMSLGAGAAIMGNGSNYGYPPLDTALPLNGGCHASCPTVLVPTNPALARYDSAGAVSAIPEAPLAPELLRVSAGIPYGSFWAPGIPGSRGGIGTIGATSNYAFYGRGGAALRLVVQDTLALGAGAVINVDGGAPVAQLPNLASPTLPANSIIVGGAGAGGSLCIVATRIATPPPGGGTLQPPALYARGGIPTRDDINYGSNCRGGGGRIAVHCLKCNASDWSVTTSTLRQSTHATALVQGGTTLLNLGTLSRLILEDGGTSCALCTPLYAFPLSTFTFQEVIFTSGVASVFLAGNLATPASTISPRGLAAIVTFKSWRALNNAQPVITVGDGMTLTFKGEEQAALQGQVATFVSALDTNCPNAPASTFLYLPSVVLRAYGSAYISVSAAYRGVAFSAGGQLVTDTTTDRAWPLEPRLALAFSSSTLAAGNVTAACLALLDSAATFSAPGVNLQTVYMATSTPTSGTVTNSMTGAATLYLTIANDFRMLGGIFNFAGGLVLAARGTVAVSNGAAFKTSFTWAQSVAGNVTQPGTPAAPNTNVGGAHAGCASSLNPASTPDCINATWTGRGTPRAYGSVVVPLNAGSFGSRVTGPVVRPDGAGALYIAATVLSFNGSAVLTPSPPNRDSSTSLLQSGSSGPSVYFDVGHLAWSTGMVDVSGGAAVAPAVSLPAAGASAGGSGGRLAIRCVTTAMPLTNGAGSISSWPLALVGYGGKSNDNAAVAAAGTIFVHAISLGKRYLLVQHAYSTAFTPSTFAPTLVLDDSAAFGGRIDEVVVTGGAKLLFSALTPPSIGSIATDNGAAPVVFKLVVNMSVPTAMPLQVPMSGADPTLIVDGPRRAQCPFAPAGAPPADLIIRTSCFLTSGTYRYAKIVIGDGASLVIVGTVVLWADSMVVGVGASIDGIGGADTFVLQMHGRGGCHASCSTDVLGTSPSPDTMPATLSYPGGSYFFGPYGHFMLPRAPGGPGGAAIGVDNNIYGRFGNGGAALELVINGTLSLSPGAAFLFDGGGLSTYLAVVTTMRVEGGAGAGGSVLIWADAIELVGGVAAAKAGGTSISVRGGALSPSLPGVTAMTSGGGGRIAVYCNTCDWAGTLKEGIAFSTSAANATGGTVFIQVGPGSATAAAAASRVPLEPPPNATRYLITDGDAVTREPVLACPLPLLFGFPRSSLRGPRAFTFDEVIFRGRVAALGVTAGVGPFNGTDSTDPTPVSLTINRVTWDYQPMPDGTQLLPIVSVGSDVTLALPDTLVGARLRGVNTVLNAVEMPPCPARPFAAIYLQLPVSLRVYGSGTLYVPPTVAGVVIGTSQFLSLHGMNVAPLVPGVSILVGSGGTLAVNNGSRALPCLRLAPGSVMRLDALASSLPSATVNFTGGLQCRSCSMKLDVAAAGTFVSQGGPVLLQGASTLSLPYTTFWLASSFVVESDVKVVGKAALQGTPYKGAPMGANLGGAGAGCPAPLANMVGQQAMCGVSSLTGQMLPTAYGSAVAPREPGSTGGVSAVTNSAIAARGTLRLQADFLQFNGTLVMSGPDSLLIGNNRTNITVDNLLAGAPSGASIFITAKRLGYSTGVLAAAGGSVASPAPPAVVLRPSAGGGGGRIAVVCEGHDFPPTLDHADWPLRLAVDGGSSNDGRSVGGAGTGYWDCPPALGTGPTASGPSLLAGPAGVTALGPGRYDAGETFVYDALPTLIPFYPGQLLSRLDVRGWSALRLINSMQVGAPLVPPSTGNATISGGGSANSSSNGTMSSASTAVTSRTVPAAIVVASVLATDGFAALPRYLDVSASDGAILQDRVALGATVRLIPPVPGTVVNASPPPCPVGTPATALDIRTSCAFAAGSYSYASIFIAPNVTVLVDGAVALTVNSSFELGANAIIDGIGRAPLVQATDNSLQPGIGGCHAGCAATVVAEAANAIASALKVRALWALNTTWVGGLTYPLGGPGNASITLPSTLAYGSFWRPTTPGSRGGPGRTSIGVADSHYGRGGAAFYLNCSVPGCVVRLGSNAAILMGGGPPKVQSGAPPIGDLAQAGGCGAGGSILIDAWNITANASAKPVLAARGGVPADASLTYNEGAAGGGGRIAVFCSGCPPSASDLSEWPFIATTCQRMPLVNPSADGTTLLPGSCGTLLVQAGTPPPGASPATDVTAAPVLLLQQVAAPAPLAPGQLAPLSLTPPLFDFPSYPTVLKEVVLDGPRAALFLPGSMAGMMAAAAGSTSFPTSTSNPPTVNSTSGSGFSSSISTDTTPVSMSPSNGDGPGGPAPNTADIIPAADDFTPPPVSLIVWRLTISRVSTAYPPVAVCVGQGALLTLAGQEQADRYGFYGVGSSTGVIMEAYRAQATLVDRLISAGAANVTAAADLTAFFFLPAEVLLVGTGSLTLWANLSTTSGMIESTAPVGRPFTALLLAFARRLHIEPVPSTLTVGSTPPLAIVDGARPTVPLHLLVQGSTALLGRFQPLGSVVFDTCRLVELAPTPPSLAATTALAVNLVLTSNTAAVLTPQLGAPFSNSSLVISSVFAVLEDSVYWYDGAHTLRARFVHVGANARIASRPVLQPGASVTLDPATADFASCNAGCVPLLPATHPTGLLFGSGPAFGGAHAGCGGSEVQSTGVASCASLSAQGLVQLSSALSTLTSVPMAYGSAVEPIAVGSFGGDGGGGRALNQLPAGAGLGAAALYIDTWALAVNGTISASAYPVSSLSGDSTAAPLGAGSGGSVYLKVRTLLYSTGTITAAGGRVMTSMDALKAHPGGGSGGRIALACSEGTAFPSSLPVADWPLKLSAPGGASVAQDGNVTNVGAAGTVFVACNSTRGVVAPGTLIVAHTERLPPGLVSPTTYLYDLPSAFPARALAELRITGGARLMIVGPSLASSSPSANATATAGATATASTGASVAPSASSTPSIRPNAAPSTSLDAALASSASSAMPAASAAGASGGLQIFKIVTDAKLRVASESPGASAAGTATASLSAGASPSASGIVAPSSTPYVFIDALAGVLSVNGGEAPRVYAIVPVPVPPSPSVSASVSASVPGEPDDVALGLVSASPSGTVPPSFSASASAGASFVPLPSTSVTPTATASSTPSRSTTPSPSPSPVNPGNVTVTVYHHVFGSSGGAGRRALSSGSEEATRKLGSSYAAGVRGLQTSLPPPETSPVLLPVAAHVLISDGLPPATLDIRLAGRPVETLRVACSSAWPFVRLRVAATAYGAAGAVPPLAALPPSKLLEPSSVASTSTIVTAGGTDAGDTSFLATIRVTVDASYEALPAVAAAAAAAPQRYSLPTTATKFGSLFACNVTSVPGADGRRAYPTLTTITVPGIVVPVAWPVLADAVVELADGSRVSLASGRFMPDPVDAATCTNASAAALAGAAARDSTGLVAPFVRVTPRTSNVALTLATPLPAPAAEAACLRAAGAAAYAAAPASSLTFAPTGPVPEAPLLELQLSASSFVTLRALAPGRFTPLTRVYVAGIPANITLVSSDGRWLRFQTPGFDTVAAYLAASAAGGSGTSSELRQQAITVVNPTPVNLWQTLQAAIAGPSAPGARVLGGSAAGAGPVIPTPKPIRTAAGLPFALVVPPSSIAAALAAREDAVPLFGHDTPPVMVGAALSCPPHCPGFSAASGAFPPLPALASGDQPLLAPGSTALSWVPDSVTTAGPLAFPWNVSSTTFAAFSDVPLGYLPATPQPLRSGGGAGGLKYVKSCAAQGYTDPATGSCTNSSAPGFGLCAWGSGSSCRPCSPRGLCPGGGRLWALPGYYAPESGAPDAAPCPFPSSRCLGYNPALGAVQCATGYRQGVPYCRACDSDYYQALDGSCQACPTRKGLALILVPLALFLAGLLGAAAVLFGVVVAVQRKSGGTLGGGAMRTLQFLVAVILGLQTVVAVGNAASPGLPPFVLALYKALAFLHFEGVTAPLACTGSQPFVALYLQATVVGLLALLLSLSLWVRMDAFTSSVGDTSGGGRPSALGRCCRRYRPAGCGPHTAAGRRAATRCGRLQRLVITVAALLYPPVVNTVLSSLACTPANVSYSEYTTLQQDGTAAANAGVTPPAGLAETCAATPWDPSCSSLDGYLAARLDVHLLSSQKDIVCYEGMHAPAFVVALVLLGVFVLGYPLVSAAIVAASVKRARGRASAVAAAGGAAKAAALGADAATFRERTLSMRPASAAGGEPAVPAATTSSKPLRAKPTRSIRRLFAAFAPVASNPLTSAPRKGGFGGGSQAQQQEGDSNNEATFGGSLLVVPGSNAAAVAASKSRKAGASGHPSAAEEKDGERAATDFSTSQNPLLFGNNDSSSGSRDEAAGAAPGKAKQLQPVNKTAPPMPDGAPTALKHSALVPYLPPGVLFYTDGDFKARRYWFKQLDQALLLGLAAAVALFPTTPVDASTAAGSSASSASSIPSASTALPRFVLTLCCLVLGVGFYIRFRPYRPSKGFLHVLRVYSLTLSILGTLLNYVNATRFSSSEDTTAAVPLVAANATAMPAEAAAPAVTAAEATTTATEAPLGVVILSYIVVVASAGLFLALLLAFIADLRVGATGEQRRMVARKRREAAAAAGVIAAPGSPQPGAHASRGSTVASSTDGGVTVRRVVSKPRAPLRVGLVEPQTAGGRGSAVVVGSPAAVVAAAGAVSGEAAVTSSGIAPPRRSSRARYSTVAGYDFDEDFYVDEDDEEEEEEEERRRRRRSSRGGASSPVPAVAGPGRPSPYSLGAWLKVGLGLSQGQAMLTPAPTPPVVPAPAPVPSSSSTAAPAVAASAVRIAAGVPGPASSTRTVRRRIRSTDLTSHASGSAASAAAAGGDGALAAAAGGAAGGAAAASGPSSGSGVVLLALDAAAPVVGLATKNVSSRDSLRAGYYGGGGGAGLSASSLLGGVSSRTVGASSRSLGGGIGRSGVSSAVGGGAGEETPADAGALPQTLAAPTVFGAPLQASSKRRYRRGTSGTSAASVGSSTSATARGASSRSVVSHRRSLMSSLRSSITAARRSTTVPGNGGAAQ